MSAIDPMSKDTRSSTSWVTEGFDSFRRGTFGNGGHNLYVSRAGVIQRIHQYDLNRDGYVDLLFCNSQNHWEAPPSYVYQWTGERFARREIECRSGSSCGALADLNGDGKPELIIGHRYDGVTFDQNAGVYYGSDRGWGEHAVQYLPVGQVSSVAAGDFDGDGRNELVFQRPKDLRVYKQTKLGIEPAAFRDLPITGFQLTAADLDGDGFNDLVVLHDDGSIRVYWGGDNGLDVNRWSLVPMTAMGRRSVLAQVPEIQIRASGLSPSARGPRSLVSKVGRTSSSHTTIGLNSCLWTRFEASQ